MSFLTIPKAARSVPSRTGFAHCATLTGAHSPLIAFESECEEFRDEQEHFIDNGEVVVECAGFNGVMADGPTSGTAASGGLTVVEEMVEEYGDLSMAASEGNDRVLRTFFDHICGHRQKRHNERDSIADFKVS